MSTDEKFNLITKNLANDGEVLTKEELTKLIESGTPLRHYIGFEISGKLHIGHFYQLMKVKDLQEAGAETIIWLADYHSAVNDKLGGDLETIKEVANNYFIPAMKALFECIGGDPEKLIFKLCSEEYASRPDFWLTFLEMAKETSLARAKRSITILGREEAEDGIETAKIMYPIMQAADIFLLQVNIAQAGMDQRKVHVIARDNALHIKTNPIKNIAGETIKPIALHTPILLGLTQPGANIKPGEVLSWGTNDPMHFVEENPDDDTKDIAAMRTKMSKSKADSAVSVHDDPEIIKSKINLAFAPEGSIVFNPVLNWTRYLIFNNPDTIFTITRPEKWGGDLTYTSYEDLEKDYADKKLHPQDLKGAVAQWLVEKLAPAREYFMDPTRKAALERIEELTKK